MKRKLFVFLAVLASSFALNFSSPVFAAGDAKIIVSNQNPQVGDSVNVEVRASDSGSVTLAYNSDVLQVASVSGDGASASGNTITFSGSTGSVTFTAANAGNSALVVSSDNQKLSSLALPVTAAQQQEQTQQGQNTQEEAAGAQQPQTGNTDYTVDGTAYTISEKFSNSEVPAGFTVTRQTVHNYDYKVAQNDAAGLTLIYLKPASDISQKGTFFLYQASDDSVSPLHLIGSLQQYVIPQDPDSLFRDDLAEAQVNVDDTAYTMYQVPNDNSGLYYIYGTDQNGTKQWYQYDSQSGSVQRINPALLDSDTKSSDSTAASAGSSSTKASSTDSASKSSAEPQKAGILSRLSSLPRTWLLGGLAAAIVIVILLILMIFRKHRRQLPAESETDDIDDMMQTDENMEEDHSEQEQDHPTVDLDFSDLESDQWAGDDTDEAAASQAISIPESEENDATEVDDVAADASADTEEDPFDADTDIDAAAKQAGGDAAAMQVDGVDTVVQTGQEDSSNESLNSQEEDTVPDTSLTSEDTPVHTEDFDAHMDSQEEDAKPSDTVEEPVQNTRQTDDNHRNDVMDRLARQYGSEMIFEQEDDTETLPSSSEVLVASGKSATGSQHTETVHTEDIGQKTSENKEQKDQKDNKQDDAEPEFKMIDLDDL